mmetsp:Transcript_3405/g.13177  ORF Transcript_3405/g.13177 Transcript_3405/m.13177 type:complete len:234 (+) Transcript_3405:833-1534(+)
MRRRSVYRTNVGKLSKSSGPSRWLDRRMSASAMFCIEHSRRPPLVPFASTGFVRFINMPGNAARDEPTSASRMCFNPTYKTFVFAGYALSVPPSPFALSLTPSRSRSVYSMLDTPYTNSSVRAFFFSMSTLTPSEAPTCLSQLANPSALSPLMPTPERDRSVVSVPAIGFVIWRTIPPVRSRDSNQSNTPSSCMSFQMAPCPPGLSAICEKPSLTQRPPSMLITGTSGCSNNR